MKSQSFTSKLLCAFLLFSAAALTQTSTGAISGMVQDESGGVIPGVSVTVTNVDTGVGRSVPSDASGRYHVPSLIPGHYEVQAQMAGFETGIHRGLQVTVGSELVINLVLKVGQVTQQTVVTAEAPMVETATSSVSGLVDDKTIRELPLNGRSFDQLISLESSAPTFHARGSSALSGTSAKYSVNGARTFSSIFLIDGTEMLSAGTNTQPGGALGINMGVDAVQEFSVLSSNYSAAYGKKAGGVINIATRSGTNQIHGSTFEFLRNSVLDARNFFDAGSAPPPFKRNNFGGALGGPIRKDSSFVFGNYEGLRSSLGLSNVATVPDANARLGLLPGPNGQTINVGLNPAVLPYLAALYPLPNGRNFGDGTGEYLSNPQLPSRQDFFLVRFDQKLSDKDSFFTRYNFTRARQTNPDPMPPFAETDRSRDQTLTLEERRAYATTVNLVRFGFTRGELSLNDASTAPLDSSLRFFPSANGVGTITFSATTSALGASGTLTRAGAGVNLDRWFIVNQFDIGDQVFHYRGPHSLQFGVRVQRIQYNDHLTSAQARGAFQFTDLASFLAGRPSQFQGPPQSGNADPTKAWRQVYFSSFLQDDYKVRRNLTLNLGLRYELMTVPAEASGNRVSNFHFHNVNGLMVTDSLPAVGEPLFEGHHKMFAPRIGFAWDPFGDGKLAVRGGFGMFYDFVDYDWRGGQISNNLPFDSILTVRNPPFPLGFSGSTGTPPLPGPQALDVNWPITTLLQYNFGIQRQVTSTSVIDVAYVGSRTYHLVARREGNTAVPQILPGNVYFYPAGSQRLNPNLANVRLHTPDAGAWYNSLQLSLIQRASHNIRYKISYTYSKSMDEASNTVNPQAIGDATGVQNPFDRKADYGLSAYSVRNSLAANFTYDVPWNDLSGLSGRLLGGWQLGGIVTIQGGNPFSALTGFNRSRDLATTSLPDRPHLKAGASNNPVLGGPDKYFDPTVFELEPAGFYGNLGRNTLVGPGFANLDVTLSKMTAVSERLKIDFRSEFFNFSNRANFSLPNNKIFNSSGQILGVAGRIQSTASTSRQIQFGLKLLF